MLWFYSMCAFIVIVVFSIPIAAMLDKRAATPRPAADAIGEEPIEEAVLEADEVLDAEPEEALIAGEALPIDDDIALADEL